ncbi:Asp23/Gls24 family envelope stress response protein [Enterococcus sp. DIV0876]|uniref:Asp23/Gls24 family envelope stress response protein n=1 Tax=Enterococcus sp. DIV0876 TaxID=2774633 RepID=UPI003D2FD111
MTYDQQTKNQQETTNALSFEEKVIETIIGAALTSVDGLISLNGRFITDETEALEKQEQVASGINVEMGKEEIAIDLEVVVLYGKDIPKLFRQIQEIVRQEVSRLTTFTVKEINIRIADVVTQETFEKMEILPSNQDVSQNQ